MAIEDTLFSDRKIIIASYTHVIKGKYTTIGGPGLALKDFLSKRAKKLVCIWQPLAISDTLSVIIETYGQDGCLRTSRLPFTSLSLDKEKAVSLLYILLKIRDIFSVIFYFIFRPQKFDVFIGVEAVNAMLGVWLRRLGLVRRVIYYNLDYGIKRFDNAILNYIFHFLDKFAVNNSDATWSLSEQMVSVRQKKGIANTREHPQLVVPVGINFYQIKRLPLEKINRKAIAYLGILEELQGVQLVIESFKQILQAVPDASFIIIGSGVFEGKLKELVKEKGLGGNIKFTGMISDEDARDILCESAVGVAPYFDDPYSNTRFTEPTKPKTYLSCGLPVVITRVPRIALEIEKAGAGMAINYNQEELTGALIKMLTDDGTYKEYRKNAIAFAAKYDWQNIFEGAFRRSFEPCT